MFILLNVSAASNKTGSFGMMSLFLYRLALSYMQNNFFISADTLVSSINNIFILPKIVLISSVADVLYVGKGGLTAHGHATIIVTLIDFVRKYTHTLL